MSRFRRLGGFVLALALVLILTNAASAVVIRHDRLGSHYTDLAKQARSVGRVVIGGENGIAGYGSGTLIGGQWVLTAGHVADGAHSLRFRVKGQTFKADKWYIHEGWGKDLVAGNDIALIHLTEDVTDATGIRAAKRYYGRTEVGRRALNVGWGTTGDGLTGGWRWPDQALGGFNRVDKLGGWMTTSAGRENILLQDFDGPSIDGRSSMFGSATGDNLEGLIDNGDSGGGMFVKVNNQWRLAGVHSFGFTRGADFFLNSDYGESSGHIRVSSYNSWIDGVMAGTYPLAPEPRGVERPDLTLFQYHPGFLIRPLVAAVPEPATAGVLGVGAVALAMRRRSA